MGAHGAEVAVSTSTRLRALVGAGLLGGSLLVLPGAVPAAAADARTCSDFDDQPAAQAAFEADRTGLADLDRDQDGIACNSLLLASSQELLERIVVLQCGTDYAEQVDALRGELSDLTGDGSTTGGGTADGGTTDGDTTDNGTTDGDTTDGGTTDGDTSDTSAADAQDTLAERAAQEAEELVVVLDAQTASLNNCVATDVDVDPSSSDGSVPITSGGQVSVVPEGSAATGEA